MAGYREHISVSTLLGVGYGAGATFALGFTPAQGALAGFLTAFGGMLPDLDSETGKPVRELFGLLGAIGPLIMMGRIAEAFQIPSQPEYIILTFIVLYYIIRYGGAWLVGTFAVHRGMFHSIPAMIIAAEITFLAYKESETAVKFLMAGAIAVGFFSHLLLDELYSVQWTGVRLKLAKSAGTALKFTGKNMNANIIAYGLLIALSYAALSDMSMTQTAEAESLELPELRQAADTPEIILR